VLVAAAVPAAAGAGCTLLVQFDDQPASLDGAVADTTSRDRGSDEPDGAPDLPDVIDTEDVVVDASVCLGRSEGYNWDNANANARCCDGAAVVTTTNANCGVCGVRCNTGAGQACQTQNGHYMCRGCDVSTDCWAGCCSTTYTPHNCTPNNPCGNGTCSDLECQKVAGPAATCMTQANGSNYCAYP
jgi:hypothetical protein